MTHKTKIWRPNPRILDWARFCGTALPNTSAGPHHLIEQGPRRSCMRSRLNAPLEGDFGEDGGGIYQQGRRNALQVLGRPDPVQRDARRRHRDRISNLLNADVRDRGEGPPQQR